MNLFLKKLFFVCSVLPLCMQADDAELLAKHVKRSIKKAKVGESNLTNKILQLDGLSSSKVRHLLNNICSLPNSRYLEIGVYKGSTFISAVYRNNLLDAIAIDNWSEFGFQKNIFFDNCMQYLDKDSFRVYEGDSFSVNLTDIFSQPVNIYFYDGHHSYESQYKAFMHYNEIFADTFIAIVDDWNWDQVRNGTQDAFKALGYTVLFEKVLPARYNCDKDNWWNGLYVAVIKKPARNNN